MLQKVIDAVQNAAGPTTIKQLAAELKMQPTALEGMVLFLERKGRLEIRNYCLEDSASDCGSCKKCKDLMQCEVVQVESSLEWVS